ncbi:APC family permease [Peptostreptococcus russellii]|uniref:Amino acid/polyamine/organocation transporter, APC superfamily n=1 Tax=Peptostreptococcus russellii TaxID=215200 RepID=A0A1H8KB04_9FIRM|nr:amino acid permease [Peptostreptococcus russellii]SEN90143.1 amino acid/polyamine/organocation transporter, APC superfamily [Peptostreptococcus russellii]
MEKKSTETNGMVKNVGVITAMFTVVGTIIGAGVFFKPQAIYAATGGAPGLGIIGWIVAGIITLCAGLTVAELASTIPKTGGMIVYIREIYGDKLGFLAGWVQVFLYFPGIIAALSVIFADQFVILTGIDWMRMPLILGLIVFVAVFNLLGSKQVSYLGNLATVCKVSVLIIIIIAGFTLGKGNNPIVKPFVAKGVNPFIAGGEVLLAIFYSFDGWINVCALAGEMKNPAKDLAKAMIGGLIIVMSIFIVINIAYLKVLPASTLAHTPAVAQAVVTEIFGSLGGRVVGVGIMISVFGCVTAYSFTGSRVLYALAEEDILPKSKKLIELNKNMVPQNSIILMSTISAIYALSGQFNLLTDFAIFSIWIFIVLTFIAVFKNRKIKDIKTFGYKIPLYPIVPIIAIIGGVFVLVIQLISSTLLSIGSLLILSIGIPIYNLKNKKSNKKDKL